MIPRLKADLRVSDLAALLPRPGDDIAAFEKAFAKLAGQKHAIAFPYGRTAQMALLQTLQLRERGQPEVICPSYTCVVVPHAIVLSGLQPVFVDCAPDGFNMDWDYLERATGPNTGAVIITSLFGHPIDIAALDAYRRRHPDITILQDCAHSFMASIQGRFVQQEGLAAFYGLNISKIMTSIFGGMITTNDDTFAAVLRTKRDAMCKPAGILKSFKRSLYLGAVIIAFMKPVYAAVNWLERRGFLDHFVKYYDPSFIDFPNDAFEDMCPIEARIGKMQCTRYADIVTHRRNLARLYAQGLQNVVALPADESGATYSHFVIRTPHAATIKNYCLKNGVQLGELIEYEIPDMPTYQTAPYFGERRSRALPGQVLNLPVHMGVAENDALRIITLIKESLNHA